MYDLVLEDIVGFSTYKGLFFSTHSQCLYMNDRRSLIKFDDITWPSLHFIARSVFYRSAFHRLVCRMVNLWDVDLKFLGQFLILTLRMVQRIFKFPCPEVTFLDRSYLSLFRLSWHIIYRPMCYFKTYCGFCTAPWSTESTLLKINLC